MPNEILRMIFCLSIPPSFFLDSSICIGPESPWCLTMETKKSLLKVCRRWWHVATPIFYEEVALRHMTQLAALIHTLEIPDIGIGSFIRKVDIKCYVAAIELQLLESQLQRLFSHCPNVTWVDYDAITSPEPLFWVCSFRHLALSEVCQNLTSLECGENIDFGSVISGLRSCSRLQSLTCHLGNQNDEPWPVGREPSRQGVELVHIQALHCNRVTVEHAQLGTSVSGIQVSN